MNNEHAKLLAKASAGFPGLTFTEANFLAYLEEFEQFPIEDFRAALKIACTESKSFFPSIPIVSDALLVVFKNRKLAERNEKNKRNQDLLISSDRPAMKPGWLYEMFCQKKAANLK